MLSDTEPTGDQKVKFALREVASKFAFPKRQKTIEQVFCPGAWSLRIASEEKRIIKQKADDICGDLEDAFEGMQI